MNRQELPLRYGYSVTCTRFNVLYSDIPAGTTPQSVNLADASGNAFSVSQGGIVLGIRIKSDTVLAAPTLATTKVTVGSQTAGGNSFFLGSGSAPDMFTAVSDTTETFINAFKAPTNAPFGINLTFTGDGTNNFNTLTAGAFHVDVYLIQFGPINTQANVTSVTP